MKSGCRSGKPHLVGPSYVVLIWFVSILMIKGSFVYAFSPGVAGYLTGQGVGCSWSRQAACQQLRTPYKKLLSSKADMVDAKETGTSSDEKLNWFQQWYPAVPLSCLEKKGDAKSRPMQCIILDQKIVIWNSGVEKDGVTLSWSAVDDTCPHRKAPLSTGKVVPNSEGGCNLACRYHGWEFDSAGSCVKIPALERNMTASDSRVFRTPSYPTKVANGLVWVFMDPTVLPQDLPDIPAGATMPEEEYNEKEWFSFFLVNPLSHLSMTENAFDPSHAPFVHEGVSEFGGVTYTPESAIPMKRYEVVTDISKTGFTVEHTPYQKEDDPDSVTTRTFIPPCCTITKTPQSEIRIFFVPQSPRETRVLFRFGMPKPKTRLQKIRNRIFQSDTVHTFMEMSDSTTRFNDQDRITMQGQDDRKTMGSIVDWKDVYPTTSDVGVKTYQRWIRKYGAPFASYMQTNVKPMSMWDRHGKHCFRCQRSLKRLISLQKRASKGANVSLVLSGFAGAISLFNRKCRSSLSSASVLSSLFLLAATVTLRGISSWAAKTEHKMFDPDGPNRQIGEVYKF